MKRYAVICAMEEEAQMLVEELALPSKERYWPQVPVFSGEYRGKEILVAVCGIGKVFAAMTCQKIIDDFSPDLVINLGIAGGVAKGIAPGDICVSSDFVQYDYDLSPVGRPVGKIDLCSLVHFPAEKSVCEALVEISSSLASGRTFLGTFGTGDRFVSSSALASELNSVFGAVCCEMEGAAIAQVCYLNGIGCCGLRAMSDNANEEAHTDVEAYSERAVRESTKIIKAFFEN